MQTNLNGKFKFKPKGKFNNCKFKEEMQFCNLTRISFHVTDRKMIRQHRRNLHFHLKINRQFCLARQEASIERRNLVENRYIDSFGKKFPLISEHFSAEVHAAVEG